MRVFAAGCVTLWLVAALPAQEWPRFRGPNGSGVSAATLPTSWTEKDYRWQVKLPGPGHSSPILWGERLFVTSQADGKLRVLCLDAGTGRTHWNVPLATTAPRGHKDNNLASSTPSADEKHVYVAWGTPKETVLLALTHDGKEAWRRDLGPYRPGHGFGSSPMVHGDLVILTCEDNGKDCLVAVESATGKERWRVARKSRNTYATPCIYQPMGRAEMPAELIAVSYEDGITSLDPRTGKLHWAADVFDKRHVEASIASPIVHGDLVLGSSGWLSVRYETIAVRSRMGKIEKAFVLERDPPLVPTPIAKDDLLFLWNDRGIVTCCDVQTGQRYWSERVDGSFYASPIIAGGHLYCPSREGNMHVLAASKKYVEVARIPLGEGTHATCAVANGRMYVRTLTRVMCRAGK